MNIGLRIVAVAGCVAVAGLAPLARGQFMTPPPEQVTPVDIDVVRVPRMVIPPPTPEQMASATNLSDVMKQNKPQRKPLPTDVEYTALIQKDAAGKVLPLADHLHLAALKKNPKVPADFLNSESTRAFLAERRKTMEHVLINNLDLVDQIEDGLFENAKFNEREKIQSLLNAVKPLSHPAAPHPLTKEMRTRQLLTEEQADVNEELIRKYTFAVNQSGEANMPEEERKQQAWHTIIALYKQNVDEFVHINHELGAAAAMHASEIVPKLGLDAGAAGKVSGVLAAAASAGSPANVITALKPLREAMTLDQRKELLRAAAAFVGK